MQLRKYGLFSAYNFVCLISLSQYLSKLKLSNFLLIIWSIPSIWIKYFEQIIKLPWYKLSITYCNKHSNSNSLSDRSQLASGQSKSLTSVDDLNICWEGKLKIFECLRPIVSVKESADWAHWHCQLWSTELMSYWEGPKMMTVR